MLFSFLIGVWDLIDTAGKANLHIVKHTLDLYPAIFSILAIAILYFLWYIFKIVHQPLIYGGKDGLQEYLLTHCPVLSELYRPTFWAWHYHAMTILRPLIQKCIPILYRRQILTLPDGGIIALDWTTTSNIHQNSNNYMCNDNMSNSTPILLIIPGLTGDSTLNYVLHFANDGMSQGYRCVIFNQRGMGNLPITTPQIVAASNVADLEIVLDAINALYPQAPIVGVGTSLGGIIFTQYLHSKGKDSKMSACINFSMPWNVNKTRPSLEDNWINRKLYVNFLLNRLKYIVKRDVEMLSQLTEVNIDKVLKASTLTEFDKELTIHCYGFDSCEEYYTQCSIYDKLSGIRVPFVAVMSMDDPFAPSDSIPISEFERNPNTVLLLTHYGGHFGFIEGAWPRGQSWMNRVLRQYLAAMKLNFTY